MKAVLCWTGGKRSMLKEILRRIPPHRKYVEAFVGAGWVFFGKEPSPEEIINDLDKHLMGFYRDLKKADAFKCNMTPNRERFDHIRAAYKDSKPLTMCDFVYLNKYSFRCAMKGYSPGEERKCHESPNPKTCQIKSTVDDFSNYKQRMTHVKIDNRDRKDVVQEHDAADTFFFLDPPYFGTSCDYAHCDIDLEEMSGILRKVKGKFLLTTNDAPHVVKAFKGFKIERAKALYGMGNHTGMHFVSNLMIRNYEGVFDKN